MLRVKNWKHLAASFRSGDADFLDMLEWLEDRRRGWQPMAEADKVENIAKAAVVDGKGEE